MAVTLNASNSGTGGLSVTSDATGNLAFQTAGTTAVTVDTSQNVGIGTTSPAYRVDIQGTTATQRISSTTGTNAAYQLFSNTGQNFYVGLDNSAGNQLLSAAYGATLLGSGAYPMVFGTNNTERMRIFSTGNVGIGTGSAYATVQFYVGTDTNGSTGQGGVSIQGGSSGNTDNGHASGTSSGATYQRFIYNASVIGSISQNGTTAVAYNTSSDYRLKNTIAPMTGALNKVQALKPVTYKWNADGSDGEGFIAHELAEVCPHAVTGAKDAVDADGNPVYQGIDTSFLVATLTAAIQELKAINDTQAATINALTARIVALEK
jgi:hypothetical protein